MLGSGCPARGVVEPYPVGRLEVAEGNGTDSHCLPIATVNNRRSVYWDLPRIMALHISGP